MTVPYEYVAYIDEAGDDGLKAVKPLSTPGSSEWLILSGVLIRAKNQSSTKEWVQRIHDELRSKQARAIHFAKLSHRNKILACETLASLDARYFVVASNKKNMQGYKNPDAEKIPSQNWFYCWMSRVLLERITRYVYLRSMKDYGEPKFVRLEYSERGGLRYSQMHAYYEWLKLKRRTPFLPWGKIEWDTLHPNLFNVYPHWQREGLQLADIVASAFFKACDKHDTGECDNTYAKLLEPRMAREPDTLAGVVSGYGVKLLPNLKVAALDSDQEEIFRHYGYPKQWWDPTAFA